MKIVGPFAEGYAGAAAASKGHTQRTMTVADRPPAIRLHARPALAVSGALALGIVLETRAGAGFPLWAYLLAGSSVVPVGVALATRGRIVTPMPAARALATCAALVALGGARMAAWQTLPPDDIALLVQAAAAADTVDGSLDGWVRGRVAEMPATVASGTRIRVSVDSVGLGPRQMGASGLVEVTLARPRNGDVSAPAYPALALGDHVALAGRIRAPPPRRNPADFDYGAYLRRLGVGATMRVSDSAGVVRIGPTDRPLLTVVAGVQAHTRRAVLRHVRGEEAQAILLALLIADRSGIDPETRDAFARTGLTHLLAVSGLHILLVGLVLYNLLRPSLVRLGLGWRGVEVSRSGITLVVLGVYALVTGASPSVVRAVVMAGAMVAGRTLQRPMDALNGLGLAALGLILWRPTALFDVGFQLSYAAVGALVLLSPVFLSAIPRGLARRRALHALIGMLVASVAATMGTAPVLLYHFGQVPLGGLLLNIPAIPVANVALGAGLGLALAAGIAPHAADAFAAVAELATAALLAVNSAGDAAFEWSILRQFVTGPGPLMAIVCGLFAVASWRHPPARWRFVGAGAALLALGTWRGVSAGEHRPRLDALFLDVGQGDATLISLPGDRHLLVDAGPRDETWDAGARTVAPHLRRLGIRRLDAVVISHPHADHFGGLEAVLLATDVGRVITNGQPSGHPLFQRALQVSDSLGVTIHTVVAGDTLDLGPGLRARILSPRAPPAPSDDGSTINDGSLVLRIQYGATSMLLTGDAEQSAEADLVERYGGALRSNVIKVGHHGSRTSSTPAFVGLAGARDAWAVIQVARRNRYGLPDEEPLARWMSAGARVLMTSSEGAVWLRSNGQRFERVEWR